jgi:hypothetical protein
MRMHSILCGCVVDKICCAEESSAMGNAAPKTGSAVPYQDPRVHLGHDLPKFICQKQIGNGKFMKSYEAKADGVLTVVKVYMQHPTEVCTLSSALCGSSIYVRCCSGCNPFRGQALPAVVTAKSAITPESTAVSNMAPVVRQSKQDFSHSNIPDSTIHDVKPLRQTVHSTIPYEY